MRATSIPDGTYSDVTERLAREMTEGYRSEAEDSSLDPAWSEVETEGL